MKHTKLSGSIIKPKEVFQEVEKLYEVGLQRGNSTGWPGLDEYITVKSGTTFYIYGQPFSGKSEWWFELLVNLTCLYGWRHAIFSPETGQAHNIVAELISKFSMKPFYSNVDGCVTIDELHRHYNVIDEHFLIIEANDEGPLMFNDVLRLVDDWENQYGKIHTLTIDPWNELHHDFFSTHGGRQDLYLEEALGAFRRNAIKSDRVNCIITHIADQALVERDGARFYPKPTPRQIAGGQAYYRKGMNMIGLWRPPAGLLDGTGRPYEKNEVHITVDKFKPKGVGKKGEHIMYYNYHKNAFYEHGPLQHQYAIRDRKQLQLTTQSLNNPSQDDLPF